MNNSEHTLTCQWAKEHNITRQRVKNMMLEAWRRTHMFHEGMQNIKLLILALPSEVKGVEEYLVPSDGTITPRCNNWFKLTPKGQKVINDLSSKITFSEKRHNEEIFNL